MQLKRTLSNKAESSTSCRAHAGWLSIWDAPVPGKVKVHFWRLIENGLAVGVELQRRNIKTGIRCIACDKEEDLLHRF
jgi:hypothetical protein